MRAEYGIPTPYPITRECYFIRRSKKVDDRRWLIVDVSLDLPGLKYYRKPSGCLIEQLDGSGFSKVTWVEHNEVFLERCPSVIFKELAESGFAFTAGRWTTMLKHKAESEHLIKHYISGKSTVN
ncbi:putative homeobox-leucine zipper protein GLAB [Helianthus anomalus]